MQLNELQTNLLEALRALTDWGRDNTSPRDPNSPHPLLVRAAAVIAEADRAALPFTVGRNDTTGPLSRFATLAEAEAHIAVIEQTDPEGVHAGDYYVDGPEELINPHKRKE